MFKRGDSWYSDFVHDGKRYTKSWGKLSKSAAGKKDAQFQTRVGEGKHQTKAELKAQEAGNPDFSTAFDEWLEMKRDEGKAEGTVKRY